MRLFLDNAPWITLDEVNSALPPENMPEAGQINVSYVFQSETDYLYYTTHATDGIGGYSDGEGLTGGITTAYDDDGTYTMSVNLDEDQGWGMQTVWEGSWDVNVYDVPPGATLNSQLLEDHETVRLTLTSPLDVSNSDTAAGFRVTFAPTYAGLAQTYSSADAWPTAGDPSADFDIESSPTGTWYARIYDKDGGYSDYASTYVLPTLNTPIITDTSVQLVWLDVAEGESSWIVQRALYGGSFSTVATLPPNSTSWLDTGVTPGTRYQWRIRAAGEEGTAADTAWSAKHSAKTMGAPTATFSDSGPVVEGEKIRVSFSQPSDPNNLPLRYSFSTSPYWLAGSYALASARGYADFQLQQSATIYGRVINSAGYYHDYSTLVDVASLSPELGPLLQLGLLGTGSSDNTVGAAAQPYTVTSVEHSLLRYSIVWDGTQLATYENAILATDDAGMFAISHHTFSSTPGMTSYTVQGRVYESATVYDDDAWNFTVIVGTSGDDSISVIRSSQGTVRVDVGSMSYPVTYGDREILIYGRGGNDDCILYVGEGSDRNPIPYNSSAQLLGLAFFGQGGIDSDTIVGSSGDDTLGFGLDESNGRPIGFGFGGNVEQLAINADNGDDTISVNFGAGVDDSDLHVLTSVVINGDEGNDSLDLDSGAGTSLGSLTMNGGAGSDSIRIGSADMGPIGTVILNGDGFSGANPLADSISGNDTLDIDRLVGCDSVEANGGFGDDSFIINSMSNVADGVKINGWIGRADTISGSNGDVATRDDMQIYGKDDVEFRGTDIALLPQIRFDDGDPFYTVDEQRDYVDYKQPGDLFKINDTANTGAVVWDWTDYRVTHGINKYIDILTGVDDGAVMLGGMGDDHISIHHAPGMLISGGFGNDTIDLLARDSLGGGTDGSAIQGGPDDDVIRMGYRTVGHGSMAGFGSNTIAGDGDAIAGAPGQHDLLDIYDDESTLSGDHPYQLSDAGMERGAWTQYFDADLESVQLRMQPQANPSLTTTFAVNNTGGRQIIASGGIRDVVNIQEIAPAYPVHLRPGTGAYSVVFPDNSTVEMDYDHDHTGAQQVALHLASVTVPITSTLTFDADVLAGFEATIDNLTMSRNAQNLMSTVQLTDAGIVVNHFKSYVTDANLNTTEEYGIDAAQPYLFWAYNVDDGVRPGDWSVFEGICSTAAHRDVIHTNGNGDFDRRGLGSYSLSGVGWNVIGTDGVELKYTWCGDTDLDGDVDASDLGHLSLHWQTSTASNWGTSWYNADFTYNYLNIPTYQFVDIVDLDLLGINWPWAKSVTKLQEWQVT